MPWSNRKNSELLERARRVIPGGMYGHESTALLPSDFPQFFSRASGARIWDVDGNEYIDYMSAYGPNLFGYGNADVEAAARRQAELGDTLTGPSSVMVDLAEAMVSMISHADWVMFCKNGSDATSMAMTTARAYSKRRKILVASGAYHGSQPWCTPNRTGIVDEDRSHVITYRYDDIESLEAAVRAADGDLAGIFATPFKHEVFADQLLPSEAFAKAVRRICDAADVPLIVDDVRAGFRLARDSSWSTLGVKPDISCWGKAIANGHPISAMVGAQRFNAAARSIFCTGSFWFSAVPMAAAVETLRLIRETDYLEQTVALGTRLREGLDELAAAHGFSLRQTGPAQMPQILFHDDPDMRLGYAWSANALKHGVYFHPYHNMFMNAAMTVADVDLTLKASERAFSELKAHRTRIPANENPLVLARLKRAQ
ncbi:aminotransferase class III-fold pyridoxal phosphate-dependent enzyme [Mesorhizobium sp. LHD-90]|uniref:aminotransferase class III-fold pyridoxal phosphate-dependent enzyme n=1 Tax=Mesorhizobium sp. LHD-90 TaxID=3071414 RepID=UPI0027DFDCB8|nr:aminotransferase class III-fold pyridoxal phosphate-dependent enzyme [Mesorhizobium sp. LHD-90]MDQ6434105.1 aminotransferase class III-fold pyridoxal phosphate-dependent enzyme [Mesorhizobium sp. LHD-90]